MGSYPYRMLVFGDLQIPHHDEELVHDWLPRVVKDVKPDTIVANGDLVDHTGLRPNEECEHTLKSEVFEMCDVLKRLRSAAGSKCKQRIRMDGNHEERIERKHAVPGYLRSAVQWRALRGTEELDKWRGFEYRKCKENIFVQGPVRVCHGWRLNHDIESIEIAEMLGGKYEGALNVFGHTHEPVLLRQCMRTRTCPMSLYWCNHGAFCDPKKMDYTKGMNTSRWGAGVMVIEHDGKQRWRNELITP